MLAFCSGSGDESIRVVLDDKDLKGLKPLPPPSLQLLGFKPRSALKDYYNLRPSTFLYPEEQVSGYPSSGRLQSLVPICYSAIVTHRD